MKVLLIEMIYDHGYHLYLGTELGVYLRDLILIGTLSLHCTQTIYTLDLIFHTPSSYPSNPLNSCI